MNWKNAPNFVFLLALPALCLLGSLHHRHAHSQGMSDSFAAENLTYNTVTPQQKVQQNSIRRAVFAYQCAEYHCGFPNKPPCVMPVALRTSGPDSVQLSLSALRWISPNQVEVDGDYYRSSQSLGGSTYLIVRSPDGWCVKDEQGQWGKDISPALNLLNAFG